VTVRALPQLRLTSIVALRGKAEALAARIAADWNLELPMTPRRTANAEIAMVWAGPERWMMATASDEAVALQDRWDQLAASLDGVAAVTDLSAAMALLQVMGPRVRDALAKGVPVDLHPRSFATGHVALTSVAHIRVHLWQVADAPSYEIAVPRSFAVSFWEWLVHASAEYGLHVDAPVSRRPE
jgi:sarcosine oxidase subunit gamma